MQPGSLVRVRIRADGLPARGLFPGASGSLPLLHKQTPAKRFLRKCSQGTVTICNVCRPPHWPVEHVETNDATEFPASGYWFLVAG